jgi:hypothetical protein
MARDNRQPSPKGGVHTHATYGCSSQTRCRWVFHGVHMKGLRYSRPPLRCGPEEKSSVQAMERAFGGVRMMYTRAPEQAIMAKQNSPSVGLFTH